MADSLCDETLFRYRMVSLVLALKAQGRRTTDAVRLACDTPAMSDLPRSRSVHPRTLFRWLAAYHDGGIQALRPKVREPLRGSVAIEQALLDFFREQRRDDPGASIPELLRRAREKGHIAPHQKVDRVTVWRAFKRMGLPTRHTSAPQHADTRRFQYPNRMMMLLADFKHFRAGTARKKRVAIYFIDDHSRMALDVVCATSEQTDAVLASLHRVLSRFGKPGAIFVDHGPAFIADDLAQVCAQLNVALIHGQVRYPQGHGKIERFNRSAKARILRGLCHEDVDVDCSALTLRLRHDIEHGYNHLPHEALSKATPHQRFHHPAQPPLVPISDFALQQAFILPITRLVSADHVVSVGGVKYEVPRGLAGQSVKVWRHLLQRDEQGRIALSVMHQDVRVRLAEVNTTQNAYDSRASAPDTQQDPEPSAKSASDMAFERSLRPMTGPDGGYQDPD